MNKLLENKINKYILELLMTFDIYFCNGYICLLLLLKTELGKGELIAGGGECVEGTHGHIRHFRKLPVKVWFP